MTIPEFDDDLIHYIIVRRDLPFGQTLAMVAHAAAESSECPEHETVCVLGTRDTSSLVRISKRLTQDEVPHILFRDPGPMSIGVYPDKRDYLSPHFTRLKTYRKAPRP